MFGAEITEQLQRLERQVADMECRALTTESEALDQLRADLEIKQIEIDNYIRDMHQIRQDRDTFRSEITVLNAQIEMLKDKLEQVERERDSATRNLEPFVAKMKDETDGFERERQSLESALAELRRENQQLKEENAMMKEIHFRFGPRNKRNHSKSKEDDNDDDDDDQNEAEQDGEHSASASTQEEQQQQQQPSQTYGIVSRQKFQQLQGKVQNRLVKQQQAPPAVLSMKSLNTHQNSLRNNTPHVVVPTKDLLKPAKVPIAPSTWEAFAILRNALDVEEKKMKKFVVGASNSSSTSRNVSVVH